MSERRNYSGGGVGALQLAWVTEQLNTASVAGEKVIVLCHKGCLPGAVQPQGLLHNYEELQSCLEHHPGTVVAWLSAAEAAGSYARDAQGVHHISPCAAVGCAVNEDAYGVLQIFQEGPLRLRMVGRAPDPALRPQGWPESLDLPRGGQLVSAADVMGDVWQLSATLARLWLFFLYTLMTPVQPLLRMLGTAPPTDEAGGRAGPSNSAAASVGACSAPSPAATSSVAVAEGSAEDHV